MDPNPYSAPSAQIPFDPNASSALPQNRTPLVLCAIGAGLASIYWAVMTLFIVIATQTGNASPGFLIAPAILVVFYALRGAQVLKGDPNAPGRLLWLHAVGGAVAALQIGTGGDALALFHGVKIAIHVFGGITALMARRSLVVSN